MQPIRIVNSDMALLIDVSLELARSRLFMPLILRHGRGREPNICPFPYGRYQAMNPMDRCFDNAIQTANRYGLTYVEGLVICLADTIDPPTPKMVPMAHGWCIDGHGYLVDPTLHKNQDHPSLMYLGVPIRKDYAMSWYQRVGYFGCMDGDKDGRPIGVHFEDPSLWLDA